MMTSGSPNSTGWASVTMIATTLPARGAGIGFMVFMASMIIRVWPAATVSPTLMKLAAPGCGGS